MMYNTDDVIFNKKEHSLSTKDGEYYSKMDSSHYSYWYDKGGILMGSWSYDYFFVPNEEYIESAVELLNKLIKKYE